MPTTVLITQCLQRDFIEPIEAHDPLPNSLHVGRSEAIRLMGHDPSVGPVAQIMFWARHQPADKLEVLHIRDWHNDKDAGQLEHLDMFGHHCIAGSRGAAPRPARTWPAPLRSRATFSPSRCAHRWRCR